MRKGFYILVILITLFSCKKKVFESDILIPYEGVEYFNCNCPSLALDIETQFGSPDMYTECDGKLNRYPSMNPNNSDEFVYVSDVCGNEGNNKLVIYNVTTQQERVLVHNKTVGRPLWGAKDWIVFASIEGGSSLLHKIKSNGDSLTQISNGEFFHASWNVTGDNLIVFNKNKLTTEFRTFILNLNGEVVDSIYSSEWYHNGGDWSHPNYYLNYDTKNIRLIDLETKKVIKHIKAPYVSEGVQNGYFSIVNWLSTTRLLFYGQGGLYTYDITTDKVTHIKCMCGFNVNRFSHTSDFSKIIIGKSKLELIENNQKHFVDYKLFLLDPVTLEEEEIIIP